ALMCFRDFCNRKSSRFSRRDRGTGPALAVQSELRRRVCVALPRRGTAIHDQIPFARDNNPRQRLQRWRRELSDELQLQQRGSPGAIVAFARNDEAEVLPKRQACVMRRQTIEASEG